MAVIPNYHNENVNELSVFHTEVDMVLNETFNQ